MNEALTPPDPHVAPTVESAPKKHFRLVADPNGSPAAYAAVTAFEAEFDELLARLETHPKEKWVAYHWSQRVGFGTDYRAFRTECEAKYPEGEVEVFRIDPVLRCGPEETVG